MPSSPSMAVFMIAAAALLITPGPAVLYIIARSIDQGRLAGIVSVLGIASGALFHIAAAALGLSALLMSSALAFNLVKYVGAAYLIYLGVRKLLAHAELETSVVTAPKKLTRIFYEGMVVNLLNPKTALFFFAFLPQFVDVRQGPAAPQILALGLIFTIMAILSDSTYALLAGSAGHWLKGNRHFLHAQRYVAGTVYIALGIKTAFSGSASGT